MGAKFSAEMLPLLIQGGDLRAISYDSPRASAQVKSAILLAGLYAKGEVAVTEPSQSRDHTERMLRSMGAPIAEAPTDDSRWNVKLEHQVDSLQPLNITVPGDFSAAAFFMVAGSIVPNSEIRIEAVGCNPSRTGLLDLLLRMGAGIELSNQRDVAGEPVCDLLVSSSSLKGIEVGARDVVLAIDEIPIFCIAAAMAQGETRISGAEELRVKESDRLALTVSLLGSFGVEVEEFADGMRIGGIGPAGSQRAPVDAAWRRSGDHRIAMSGAVLELCLHGETRVVDVAAVETSFPRFVQTFQGVI
jgi:3-phosphoshikimate 1-carboxyvinyltransferase